MVLPAVERDLLVERHELAVDARAREATLTKRRKIFLEFALPAAHDGREDVDPLVGWIEHHQVDDALERLRRDLAIAIRTMRHADVGEEQPQVIVNFGDRSDSRS